MWAPNGRVRVWVAAGPGRGDVAQHFPIGHRTPLVEATGLGVGLLRLQTLEFCLSSFLFMPRRLAS